MILYLHGFNSAAASTKAQQVLAAATAAKIACEVPDLPDRGAQVRQLLEELGEERRESLLAIGSSLGGYYATWMVENELADHAVLINPAVDVAAKLAELVGTTQSNYYSNASYVFTQQHLDDLVALHVPKIVDPSRYLLLVQTGDEVLDYREAVAYYADALQIVEEGGDHSFAGFERHLPLIIELAQGD